MKFFILKAFIILAISSVFLFLASLFDKLTVLIDLFGQDTQVEVQTNQLKKAK